MSNNFVITVITAWFNINAYSWYWQWPYIWEIVYIARQALQWYPQVKNKGKGHAKRVFQWRWRREGASGTNWKIYHKTNEVGECGQWPILLSEVKDRVVSNIYHYELISKCWVFCFVFYRRRNWFSLVWKIFWNHDYK